MSIRIFSGIKVGACILVLYTICVAVWFLCLLIFRLMVGWGFGMVGGLRHMVGWWWWWRVYRFSNVVRWRWWWRVDRFINVVRWGWWWVIWSSGG